MTTRRFALAAVLLSFVLVSLGTHAQPRGLAAGESYVGLNLWRQLPAGTDGAYELFANLISLGGQAAGGGR